MKCLPAILLLAAACLAPGCVSTKLAESNFKAVKTVAQMSVEASDENLPEAQAAVENAAALVDAAAPIAQIASLGISSELVEANTAHVETLAATLDVTKPEVKAAVEKAEKTAARIEGTAAAQGSLVKAAEKSPLDQVLGWLELVGSAVGVIYAGTRGKKHVVNWWRTPWGEKSPSEIATVAAPAPAAPVPTPGPSPAPAA